MHGPGSGEPFGEMNATPVIDVMLVLLIMFIISIPAQTHVVKIDLPAGPPPDVIIDRLKNRVVIDTGGALYWNGRKVSDDGFRASLAAMRRIDPVPELQLQPNAFARYERVDEVLVMTKRAQVTRLGFVGNEAYQSF